MAFAFACGKDFPSLLVNTADLSMLITRAKKPRRVGSIPWQWYSPIHARQLVSSALNHVLKYVGPSNLQPVTESGLATNNTGRCHRQLARSTFPIDLVPIVKPSSHYLVVDSMPRGTKKTPLEAEVPCAGRCEIVLDPRSPRQHLASGRPPKPLRHTGLREVAAKELKEAAQKLVICRVAKGLSAIGWKLRELPSPDSFHPELPSSDPFVPPNAQVPAFITTQYELSAICPVRTPVELPFSPFADIKQRQLSDFGNIKPTVSGIIGAYPTRRSDLPRLSVVTSQSSRSEYGHSSQAISSLSNSETRETIKQDTPSLAHVDARLQTLPGASSYSTGSSSVQSSSFDGVILGNKLLLVERVDPVSPSSASTGCDPQLFDASIFRSPTSHKENIHPAQKTSKPLTIPFGQTPVVTHPSVLSHHPGVPSQGDISLVCNNYQPIPNTRMSSDTAASSSIPHTEQLLQHIITQITRVHRQCTSTCNPGTDRTIHVFGPDGYSACERGLQVLWRMYKGIIPSSADDICALLQVTLQFLSYVPSGGNNNWRSLSRNDLHLWSNAIQDKAERDLSTEAINILWVSWKCLQRPRPCASPHRAAQASSSHTSPSAADKEEQSSTLAGGPVSGRSSLDQALRDSAVIRICSGFLDELEWLDLDGKRNSFTPPFPPDRVSRNLKFMINSLIQPLLRFSSFRQDVLTVKEQVARGFPYTVREVEVMLMHHVLQHDVTKEILDEFLRSVRVHCDKALSPKSEELRNQQYWLDVEKMEISLSELKKRETQKPLEQKAGIMRDHTVSYGEISTDNPVQSSLGGSIGARPRDIQPLTSAACNLQTGLSRLISHIDQSAGRPPQAFHDAGGLVLRGLLHGPPVLRPERDP
ncbi:MAG: hypothetical protein Q9193_003963 [Seirophora villosa]